MTFSRVIDIAAPPSRVWAIMSDVERWSEWTASIASIERLDPGPLKVGSRARVRQPRLPPAVWTVTAVDPGRSFTWISDSRLAPASGHHAVEPAQAGSRATLSLRFETRLGAIVGRVSRRLIDRYLDLEAAGLKRRSEDPAFTRG
jgi:carbon monoxide dehydrogenase subunit G